MRIQTIKRLATKRLGFTLTELLVVLSIIGVLTSAMAMAVRGAQERARGYRTQAQLDKLERILQSELLKVINERSTVQLPPVGNSNFSLGPHPMSVAGTETNNNPASIGEGLFTRTRRFREESLRVVLMSRFPFEAPHLTFDDSADRYLGGLPVDRYGQPVVPFYTATNSITAAAAPEGSAPDLFQTYGRQPSWLQRYRSAMYVDAATGGPVVNPSTGVQPLDETPPSNDPNDVLIARTTSSELLYQVLRRIWVDGQPATALFRESEFGDTDGDGAIELLDAWGDPIGYRLQMRISGFDPTDATVPVTTFNCTLTNYSTWMTDFVDLTTGRTWFISDISPDSMTLSRVKAVAYSGNVEDVTQPNAAAAW